MHPLIGNLKAMSDDAITANIAKLQNVIFRSNNIHLTRQAQMALDNYLTEQNNRFEAQLEAQFKKSGKKIDDVIDIK